jgi:hypothetical protein
MTVDRDHQVKKQFYKSQPKNAFFEGVLGVPGVPTTQAFS